MSIPVIFRDLSFVVACCTGLLFLAGIPFIHFMYGMLRDVAVRCGRLVAFCRGRVALSGVEAVKDVSFLALFSTMMLIAALWALFLFLSLRLLVQTLA